MAAAPKPRELRPSEAVEQALAIRRGQMRLRDVKPEHLGKVHAALQNNRALLIAARAKQSVPHRSYTREFQRVR